VCSARALTEELAGWPRSPTSRCLLQGDLQLWNLVHAKGQAGAIDFGDCGWG